MKTAFRLRATMRVAVVLVVLSVVGAVSSGAALAAAPEDTQAPELVDLSIAPAEVDTTNGIQEAIFTAHITDDLSGIQSAGVDMRSPSRTRRQFGQFNLVSGTPTDGIFKARVLFFPFTEAGAWTALIEMRDAGGNQVAIPTAQLLERGLPATVLVKSEEDVQDPELLSLSLSSTDVDVTQEAQDVFAIAQLADDLAGVQSASIEVRSPSGKRRQIGSFSRITGSPTSGVFGARIPFFRFTEPGFWKVSVEVRDRAGNQVALSTAQLQARGLPAQILVKSEPDVHDPELVDLSIAPAEVDTTNGIQEAIFTAHITDDLSGIQSAGVDMRSPSRARLQLGQFNLVSGTPTDGIFKARIPFFPFTEAGAWTALIEMRDAGGNQVSIPTAQLLERGLPATVLVNIPPPPTLASISPDTGPEAGGTVVEITGTEFTDSTSVFFDGVPATDVTVDSPTHLTATSPPGSGAAEVLVSTLGGASRLGNAFHYLPAVLSP